MISAIKSFVTDPQNFIVGSVIMVAISYMAKRLPRKKVASLMESARFWCEDTSEFIVKKATSPAAFIGTQLSRRILIYIGKKSGNAFEEKIIITLTTWAKELYMLFLEAFIKPILLIPHAFIENFEKGLLKDNQKKESV